MTVKEVKDIISYITPLSTIEPNFSAVNTSVARLFFTPCVDSQEDIFMEEENEEKDKTKELIDRSQITLVSKLMEFGNNNLLAEFFGASARKTINTAVEVACLREQKRR